MTTKISKSTTELEEWNRRWYMVHSPTLLGSSSMYHRNASGNDALDAARSRRLIEYALCETPQASILRCSRLVLSLFACSCVCLVIFVVRTFLCSCFLFTLMYHRTSISISQSPLLYQSIINALEFILAFAWRTTLLDA